MAENNYILISPSRNEAEFMRYTLDSVLNQTVKPALWVIVDDGSSDDSLDILEEYAKRNLILKIVKREDRGYRSVGPGVIEAFYSGYETVKEEPFEFICKLDLDLILPPRYFEILINNMESNKRIGTCSGKPYFVSSKKKGRLVSEKCGDENSVGMTKFYRKTCFEQIGGFVKHVMWDGIDGHRCRMLGWLACSWDDPDLRFQHLRPMGSSQKNILSGRVRHGFGQYFMGTGFLYMTVSAIYRMFRPPFSLGGLAMWWGYVHSWATRRDRYEDLEFRHFLRTYHWSCLMYGKTRATERLNAKNEGRWDPEKQQ